MTVPTSYPFHDPHSRVNAAVGALIIFIVAAASLAVWQVSLSGGGVSSTPTAVRVDPFSPEKDRIGAALDAALDYAGPVPTNATAERRALESSLPQGVRTTTGDGHPDIRTRTVTATRPEGGGGHPLNTAPSAGTAEAFQAIEAPTALKEQALILSISDWVVDYAQAERILQDFGVWNDVVASGGGGLATDLDPEDAIAAHCTYWSTCDQVAAATPERPAIDTTPPPPLPNPNAGSLVR